LLERCDGRHRVRIAASHLSGRRSVRSIAALAGRGAQVEVLAEATHRRVPPWALARLRDAGVVVRRAIDAEGLPMHAKFALIDGPDERLVIFGSFNWTSPSQRTNFEIGAISSDPKLIDAFDGRWLDLDRYYGREDSNRV
jgi:phosphatidylserine/phosphatidylglycerophosphate/cardiolipin synthase-like enzyme